MKRFLTALGILFIVAGIVAYLVIQVSDIEQKTVAQIDHLLELTETNSKDLPEETKKFVEYWNNTEPFLTYFVRHEHIDQVSSSVVMLPSLLESDPNLFEAYLRQIKEAVEHLKHSEFPLPQN